jgi:hypothetical protein
MLLYVLPNLSQQLQSEDLDVRLGATLLLGRLFASPYADYGVQNPGLFGDFLSRFRDVEPKVSAAAATIASAATATAVAAGVAACLQRQHIRSELLIDCSARTQAQAACTVKHSIV